MAENHIIEERIRETGFLPHWMEHSAKPFLDDSEADK